MKRRYDLLYALGTLVSSPVLAFGLLRTGKWRTDWKGRFGRAQPLPEDSRPTVLLHGVSVGEINATRALVDHLTGPEAPPVRVVVSATTNTGFARAQELYGDRLPVVRFPFDFSWMVRRFLDAMQPDAVALMELELWPNLAQLCRARGIPLAVLNGRLSDESYRQYRWVRPLVRGMFGALDAVGAQTEEYAQRFRALGVPQDRITVTDTMKWDPVRLVDEVEGAAELRVAMGIDPAKPLVVAGSTGPGEEELLLAGKPPGVQLLLVPRKPERFEEVAALAPEMVRRSQRPHGLDGGETDSELFLLDTMGELTKAYSLADVAVVGRSFVPMGGSDPIESIALGKATVMGPHYGNFRGVVEAFLGVGGLEISESPWPSVQALLEDSEAREAMAEKGREVIRSRKGATARNADLLFRLVEKKKAGEIRPDPPGSRIRRWLFRAFLLYLILGYGTTLFSRIPLSDLRAAGGAREEAMRESAPLPSLGGTLWSGVFSVHTNRSHDARGSREDVARAARKAGLDFVVVGDHPPDDRKPGWAFWDPVFLDGTFIEGGQELRSPEAGKILAVGVDTTYKRWEGDYRSFARMLAREEATAFVVHGRGPRGSERWVHPDAEGMQGWEVLDISEFARHRLKGPWSLYHALTLVLGSPFGFGDEALLHLMREGFGTPTVAAYDSLSLRGHLTATAGLNSHPKLDLGPFLIPGYGPPFRTLVTHVVVEGLEAESDPREASAGLMTGARRGNAFISLGGTEEAASFRMAVVGSAEEVVAGSPGTVAARMGGETDLAQGLILRAGFRDESDRRLLYRVIRNGEEVAWAPGPELAWPVSDPGVYRVEVYTCWLRIGGAVLHLRPWIFGNPVRVH